MVCIAPCNAASFQGANLTQRLFWRLVRNQLCRILAGIFHSSEILQTLISVMTVIYITHKRMHTNAETQVQSTPCKSSSCPGIAPYGLRDKITWQLQRQPCASITGSIVSHVEYPLARCMTWGVHITIPSSNVLTATPAHELCMKLGPCALLACSSQQPCHKGLTWSTQGPKIIRQAAKWLDCILTPFSL